MTPTVREAQELSSSPSPDYTASPLETDLFEWHFTLRGPPSSAYAEGIYHGRIVLPPNYPLRPPSFRFTTPSGRFEANREICLSISGHHEETWQPAWGVRTALVALRSFMETDAGGQLGGLDTSDAVRRRLAADSGSWRCAGCGGRTNKEIMAECERAAREAEAEATTAEGGGGGGGERKRQEVEIPKELKMGFRDEMEKAAAVAASSRIQGGGGEEDAESAELAEGFVQTVPIVPQAAPAAPSPRQQPARPAQSVPQPTRTVPLSSPPAVLGPHGGAQAQLQRRPPALSSNGVPLWVDRGIVVLSVLLIALLFKVMSAP